MKMHKAWSLGQNRMSSLFPRDVRSLNNIRHLQQTTQLNAEDTLFHRCKMISGVSITPELLKQELVELLQEVNSPAMLSLLNHMNGWIQGKWTELRRQISSRINKLKYLQPSLIGQSFSIIEKQIMVQWKKNTLLQAFQLLGNHVFRTYKFQNACDLKKYYDDIRKIITQISFILFESCLQELIKKHISVQHKLMNFTSVNILTSSKQWKYIAENIIKPKFYNTSVSFSQNYDFEDLYARVEIINTQNDEPLFVSVADSIEKLLESYSISEIVNSLKEFRKNLLKQIQSNIQNWRKKNDSMKQIAVEKDDVLSSIIYTLVRHKKDDIGVTLKYINFLFGNDVDSVLNVYQVDCYKVDLEVAYEYLSAPSLRMSLSDSGSDCEKTQQTYI